MRFRPVGRGETDAKRFIAEDAPAFEVSRHPPPSREITAKERPELERGRKPLVEDFPLFGSWSVPRKGLEPLRFVQFWIVMARASKKRKLEDRVESNLEEVLYFRRGEVV